MPYCYFGLAQIQIYLVIWMVFFYVIHQLVNMYINHPGSRMTDLCLKFILFWPNFTAVMISVDRGYNMIMSKGCQWTAGQDDLFWEGE